MKLPQLLLIIAMAQPGAFPNLSISAAPKPVVVPNNHTQFAWGAGLAALAVIGSFFSYKFFKSWRAEENRFEAFRKALVALGARVSESISNDGFTISQNLSIVPRESMTDKEEKQCEEYANELAQSFYDRHTAMNRFSYAIVPTVIAAFLSANSFRLAFKHN